MSRRLLYAALVALFVLHNDWWLWHERATVAGLPAGLAYHLAYTAVATVVLVLLVRHAWPAHLEVDRTDGREDPP